MSNYITKETYLYRYDRLIEYCKNKDYSNQKTEKHHIKPKCIGGTDEKQNICKMSLREHFIAHYLLANAYDVGKLWSAFRIMCSRCRKSNSKLYAAGKTKMAKYNSEKMKAYFASLSDEQRKNFSENCRLRMIGVHVGKKEYFDTIANIFVKLKKEDVKEHHILKFNHTISNQNKGKVTVKNKDGEILSVSTSDERYLSGELVFYRTGTKHKASTIEKMKKDPKIKKKWHYDPVTNIEYIVTADDAKNRNLVLGTSPNHKPRGKDHIDTKRKPKTFKNEKIITP